MRSTGPVTQREQPIPPGAVLVSRTDVRGVITWANAAFVQVSGYTRAELVSQPHNLVRHPDMPPAAFADLWRTLAAGQCWVGRVKNRCKNGDHYWVRAAVSPEVEDGRVVGYVSVRSALSPAERDEAEAIYARIRAGSTAYAVDRGRIVRRGLAAAAVRAISTIRMRMALILLAVLAGEATALALAAKAMPELAWIAVALGLLLAAGALWWNARSLQSRIEQLRGALDRMATGRLDEPVALDRQDEFAAATLATANLHSRLAFARLSARETRQEALERFDQSVGGVVAGLTQSIGTMQQSARAQDTHAQSASTSAGDLATAARELAASIREIAAQSEQVRTLLHETVSAVETGRTTIARLAKASEEIGGVSQTIGDIAGQTNLLALNATIEAARAGDAGRGFAVVASEVKQLATKTQEATGDIARRIGAVQEDSAAAKQALDQLGERIACLSQAATTIASAVEEQNAVTQGIAGNAERAAEAAAASGRTATELGEAGEIMARERVALEQAIGGFKQAIAA